MSGSSSRGNPALGDIARTVIVLGVGVLVVLGVARFLMSVTPDEPTRTVDYRMAVESARPIADFPIFAPASLPDGWRATSVRYEPDSWHLGVLTDDEEYLGLEQVRRGERRAIESFADGSRAAGQVSIGGATWSRRTGPEGDSTYVRSLDDMTVLVTGSAPREQVERYVASLSSSS